MAIVVAPLISSRKGKFFYAFILPFLSAFVKHQNKFSRDLGKTPEETRAVRPRPRLNVCRAARFFPVGPQSGRFPPAKAAFFGGGPAAFGKLFNLAL
ncbi:MAG TPA: hypothetical protein PLP20_06075, partial [Oscillospiraceae bacterium]|nr:hypothetical protein [Oscillospiraceae bacterium]